MALSGLDQVHRPLEETYQPYGPSCQPPWAHLVDESPLLRRRSRSHAGFSPWRLASWWEEVASASGESSSADSVRAEESSSKGEDAAADERTTVLVTGIPYLLTRRMFLAALEEVGVGSKSFDFLFFPLHFGTRRNKGFAFVNFVDHEVAAAFMSYDQFMSSVRTKWELQLKWAYVQGRQANMDFAASKRFQHTRCSRYKPMVQAQKQP